jgi:hypothetical protein
LRSDIVSTNIFQHIAKRFIVPAKAAVSNGAAFDIEADSLLDNATVLHCLVIADLNSDRVDKYGPEQIEAGLEHLAGFDYLVGHNIVIYDLPLLHKLRGWCRSRVVASSTR